MALVVPSQFQGFEQCLFKLISANMNATTDQIMQVIGPKAPGSFLYSRMRVTNASTSLDTAVGGVYNAITKPAGGILVAAAQAYSALTGATLGVDLTLEALALGPQTLTPYLSLTTAQGAAATADIYVFGYHITNVV